MANTPITAKIKRTTRGGMVQQPLLNMGAPVKMKMSSPAKQTSGELKPGEGVLKNKEKSTAGNFEPAGKQGNFVPWAFRQDALLAGMGSKSGVKGKMGSDTRKAEYDKRNWAYDETISKASVEKAKPKVKATKTKETNTTVKGNTSPKSVKIETKLSVAKPSKKTEKANK